MLGETFRVHSHGGPRVVVLGAPGTSLGSRDVSAVEAIRSRIDVMGVDAVAPLRDAFGAYRSAAAAIRRDGYEMVHLFDARLAPVGAMLRSRFGVPVGVTVSEQDLASATPWAALSRRFVRRLDELFTTDAHLASQLRADGFRLSTTLVRPVATLLPAPSVRDEKLLRRTMRGVRPGRLIIGLIWPESRNDLRWFRDAVLPALDGKPLCIVAGAPSRREARLLLGATGVSDRFHVLPGRLDGGRLAAMARWADVFVAPAGSRPEGGAWTGIALSLAACGAPLVTDGPLERQLLEHERNAFLVTRADERSFAETINRLFALPAVQRHFLGEEFTRHTIEAWPWHLAAETYTERFAALVGRPAIPAQLRAA